MNKNKSLNFLPEEEQRAAEEALKKTGSKKEGPGISLVEPKGEKKKGAKHKEGSWWGNFKKSREEKRLQEKRRRGEVGTAVKKKSTPAPVKGLQKPKASLFGGAFKKTPRSPSSQPSARKTGIELMSMKTPDQSVVVPEPKLPIKQKKRKIRLRAKKKLPKAKPYHAKKPPRHPKKKGVAIKHIAQTKDKKTLHEPAAGSKFSGPNVNLIPEGLAIDGKPYWIFATSIVIVVIAIWVVVSGFAISRVKQAEAQVLEANTAISRFTVLINDLESGKKQAQSLQAQLNAVDELINVHIYWGPFLKELEDTTIPDVYYTILKAERGGTVSLSAIAKNYEAAARQIRAFELAPDFILDIEVNSAQIENQPGAKLPVPVVGFEILLEINPDILILPEPEI